MAGLLRSHARLLAELRDSDDAAPGPRAGHMARTGSRLEPRPACDVTGRTPAGAPAAIGVIGTPHPTLLAFLTSTCTMCAEFWSAFGDAARHPVPGGAHVVVVTKGEDGESPARLRALAPAGIPVVMSSETWDAYGAEFAPHFAFVDGPSGQIVAEGFAATWDEMVAMLGQARSDAGIGPTP